MVSAQIFCFWLLSYLSADSYDVRFEDFLWNGAEGDDESLTLSLKSNARLAAGRETFVKTATVVATVYVEGNSVNQFLCIQFKFHCAFSLSLEMIWKLFVSKDEDDGDVDCNSIDCHGDGDIDDNSLVFDKRFWLITRVGGALTEDETPKFKQRLAELYRKAFNRWN